MLGDLTNRRDWGHAREYVHAMWLMLQHETADDYVVATGTGHSVQEFVEAAFAVVDLPWEQHIKQSPALTRPAEPSRLIGSAEKILQRLGWKPTVTFSGLAREMVEAELAALTLLTTGATP